MAKEKVFAYEDVNVSYGDYLKVARYALHIKKELFYEVLIGLAITGLYVLQAVLLSLGVGSVFAGKSFSVCCSYFLGIVICIVLRTFLVRFSDGYVKRTGGKIKAILRQFIIEKLLLLGPGYQSDKRSGKFQSLVTDGVEYLEPFLVSYIPQVFVVAISVIGICIYVFSQYIPAGIIIAVSVLLAIMMPHILMKFYTRSCIGYWKNYAALNSHYIDVMQGMNTLKLFNAEGHKAAELYDASEEFRLRQVSNTKNSLFSSANIALMSGVATAITTGVSAVACSKGLISTTALLSIMFLNIECVRPVAGLNNAWHSSMMGFSVASEILEILDEPIVTAEKENALENGIDSSLPEIEFDNVSFRYSTKREKAIDSLSFRVSPGQTAAIVGSSGAGKSTILNLILRFYDIDEGSIRINGNDLKDYNLEYLRSKISVVFQSTYLFYGTVKENIRMARPDASDEEIIAAAKSANAHEFIKDLPSGYDTMVGERGETLSGGQQQRIAIARAILKNAPILILDEATSSVDAASEKLIQETMERLSGKFTTIIIAHRLSTVKNADCIYVLSDGSLAESGTHNELLNNNGIYSELISAQNRGGDNE